MSGATMHYRIVAVNENGRGESDDKELKGFVFPLATGTTWNYTYNWFQSAPGVWLNVRTRGSQTWRSGGAETANATTMLLTRVDTTLTWNFLISPETTTVITQIDTSFLVVTTSHSIIIHWYEFSHLAANDGGYLSIPRAYEAKSDTLTRENQNIKAVFVNGKGLISWQYYISAHTPWREVLTLESMYP